jgi:hypothetical protein
MERCRCGKEFVAGRIIPNSGTTEIEFRCPEWDERRVNGHQYLVTRKPEHDPQCCDTRDVRG